MSRKWLSVVGAACASTVMSLGVVVAEEVAVEQSSEKPAAEEAEAEKATDAAPSGVNTRRAGERWVEPASGMAFRYVPSGAWSMGSPVDEPGRRTNEPPTEVSLTRGFWIGETEVTQQQWEQRTGSNPARFVGCGVTCPVESITWFEALEFCNALSKKAGFAECYALEGGAGVFAGLDCDGFRLPSEAEWEWAARAGTKTALYTGDLTIVGAGNGPELDPIAWYGGNSVVEYEGGADCSGWKETQHSGPRCGPHPVGEKRPNPWALFDMLGNVWEWTWDGTGRYPAEAVVDPLKVATSAGRVVRGCAWDSGARACRVANRGGGSTKSRSAMVGLRLVRTVSESPPSTAPEP